MLAVCWTGAQAEGSPETLGELRNCDDLELPEFDEAMTRQERIEILDALLIDVLTRLAGCEGAASNDATDGPLQGASSGGGAGAVGAGAAPAPESLSGSGVEDSTAPVPLPEEDFPAVAEEAVSEATDSGRIPEDIPPADSDSLIANQIRNAALAETDPVKQAKLWNKYRQYVGLPEQPLPEEQ